MGRLIFLLCTFLCLSVFGGTIADISFQNNVWQRTPSSSPNIFLGNDSVKFMADENNYIRVQLDVSVPSTYTNVYFVAEIKLEGIVDGALNYHRPKLKIYEGGTTTNIQAFNLTDIPEGKFYQTGMVIERYDKLGLSSLRLEFSMQNVKGGTLVVKNPQLLSAPPTSTFSFPFKMPNSNTVSLDIDTAQKNKFNDDLLSSNCHFTWASYSWGDPIVQNFTNENFPMTNMRFPAGTVGNFYNYQTDGFYNDAYASQNSSAVNGFNKGFTFGYDGFKTLLLGNQASSTLMFNVISDDVNTASARLQSRLNDGLNVKYIEMGNENYYSGQNMGNASSSANYISHTTDLATALKGIDPNVKVAVNIDHDDYTSGGWNANLAAENYFDACVMHPHVQTGTFMLNELSGHKILSAYKTTRERISHFESNFPGKDLLFTEYSILSDQTPVNFVQTLGIADMFFAILEGSESGPVKQAGIHMMYHSDNYNEATLSYFDGSQMVLTANGVMYSNLFRVFKGREVYAAKGVSDELESGLPGVNARAIDHGDSIWVYVVNKLSASATLNLTIEGVSYSGPYQQVVFQEDVNVELTSPYANFESPWVTSTNNGNITLMPYSISISKIAKSDLPVVVSSEDFNSEESCFEFDSSSKTLKFNESISWRIFDLSGKLIMTGKEDEKDLGNLQSGVYIVTTIKGCSSKVSL